MIIGVVGLGKLGLPLAVLFSKYFRVCGVDINEGRIKQIRENEGFLEPLVSQYLENYGRNLTLSSDYNILTKCDVVFVMTQTPSFPSGKLDSRYVENALRKIHEVNPGCVVAIGSTINIGDTDRFRAIHRRICYNPEFIAQGSIIKDFEFPKFVIIGAYDKEDSEVVAEIWRTFHRQNIDFLSPREAETAKIALNFSFTMSIAFANIIGEMCEAYSANPVRVLDVLYRDRREYLPGLGFGGPCFVRDVKCFERTCEEISVSSGAALAVVLDVFNSKTVDNVVDMIKNYKISKVGILGIAYKSGVPYIDESQALKVAMNLVEEGYEIHVCDPLAEDQAKKVLGKAYFHSNYEEVIDVAELIFIGTPNYASINSSKPILNPWKFKSK